MKMTRAEIAAAFARKTGTFYFGPVYRYKSFRFSSVRHDEPFNKLRKGHNRRKLRNFTRKQKAYPYANLPH